MSQGQVVLVIAVVFAAGFGLWRLTVDGRFGGTHKVRGIDSARGGSSDDSVEPVLPGRGDIGSLGERATLLQFSSAFCAPCRATRRILADVADLVPGVVHLEIDAESHLDLVRELGILRTPTTLLLDAEGREVTRAAGAPRKEDVLAALADVL
ncbi:MAG: thioredoxin family protein [Nocardioidaceae bacterium]